MSVSENQAAFSDLQSRAQALDAEDRIRAVRDEFRIPTKADVKRKTLPRNGKFRLTFIRHTCVRTYVHMHNHVYTYS